MINHLEQEFEVSKLFANIYVSLHILCDRANEFFNVNQSLYIWHTLHRFGYENCMVIFTLADPNFHFDKDLQFVGIENFDHIFLYVKVIGNLQFAQMGSHLDISYTINIVAKFASCLHKNHYVAIKRIFNILQGLSTLLYGIMETHI